MKTKFGNAKINTQGYYQISNNNSSNSGKYLHRLIFEDYHNCKLDENDVIHHIDEDKLNNHPTNLICMSRKAHNIIHKYGKTHSEESKNKISESHKGKKHSEETRQKISESIKNKPNEFKINLSKSRNTTGYYNVYKCKNEKCKQGFTWKYQYYENGKRKSITSVSLDKLKQKVKSKGLLWVELK